MAAKSKNRFFVWIILGLLVVGLLGFGTGGLSGSIRNIGKAGEKDISVRRYQQALNEQIRALEAQIGQPVGFAQAQQLGVDQNALAQVVAARTIDNEAAALGLSVGDARVREEVLQVPSFRGIDGNFDREAYRFTIENAGMTEETFETSIRDEVARGLLQAAVVGGIVAPETYVETLTAYIAQRRDVTWAVVDETALTAPVAAATDAEIEAFHAENAALFSTLETRDIQFAWLSPDMIRDQITIDEDALRELYDERLSEFQQPERRLVERLVYVDAEAAADAAAQATEMDTSFDDLVASRGLELSDVDMGDVSQAELGAAGDAVFTAEVGNIVGPIETSLGPALFRVNAVLAAQNTTYEEASDDLRQELAAARARRVIEDQADRMNDLLAGGASMADLAAQTDMIEGSIMFDAQSNADIAAYDEFRIAAQNAQVGDFPELTFMDDGGVFALNLTAINQPAVKPLADVKDEVSAALLVQNTQLAVIAQAEALVESILPLTGFDTLGLAPQVEANMTRTTFVPGTPPAFLSDVFDMETGETRVIDNGLGAIIVRLDSINAADSEDPQLAAQIAATAEITNAGIAQDIFDAYAAQVQSRTDIEINQSAVNALHAQFQ